MLEIQTLFSQFPLLNRPYHSRVHPLRTFPFCYVKRDDELGFGIGGTKLRKYLSFLPFLLKHSPQEAIVIGSAHSNHVFSMAQLLIEHGVEPLLFLLGSKEMPRQGNLLLSSLFVKEENIYWHPKSAWEEIEETARQFASTRSQRCLVVSRGANCLEALPGAMTLALDIARNEVESDCVFDHIFIDSGTGLTAVALILASALLRKNWNIHVILTAGSCEAFFLLLEIRKKEMEELIGKSLPPLPFFKTYLPTFAKPFGSTNKEVFQTIREIAQAEGFLTDPVFTAKLFYEGKKILSEQKLTGNALFIHSGGLSSLMGFQDELKKNHRYILHGNILNSL